MIKSPVSSVSGMSSSFDASSSMNKLLSTQDFEDDHFFLSSFTQDPAHIDMLSLASEWQHSLEELSHNNASSLLKVSERAQNIIPTVTKAVDELELFERLMTEYSERVRSLSKDLQQIETVSNTQTTQIQNLVRLKNFIESEIIADFANNTYERDLMSKSLEDPQSVTNLAEIADRLYKVINSERLAIQAVFEKKTELETVQERFYAKLGGYLGSSLQRLATQKSTSQLQALDAVCALLTSYGPLIHCMEAASPKAFNDLQKVFLLCLQGLLKRDVLSLAEYISKNAFVAREDKSYLFPSVTRKIGMDLGLSVSGISKKKPQCTRDLSLVPLGTAPPKITLDSEGLSGSQALDYVILILSNAVIKLQAIAKTSMLSDKRQYKRFLQSLEGLLNDFESGLKGFIDQLIRLDPSLPLDMWLVMQQRNSQMYEDCSAMLKLMDNLLSFTRARTESFIEQQESRVTVKKRIGIFPYVSVFPRFLAHYQSQAKDNQSLQHLLAAASRSIWEAMQHNFDLLLKEADPEDEKDVINANVMIIENCCYLKREKLGEGPLGKSLEKYIQTGLQAYAQVALTHLIHEKILTLCQSLHSALQSGAAPQELAAQAAYSKASIRKVFSTWDSRDARQGLDKIVNRIDKHFTDLPELKEVVWLHCKGFVSNQVQLFNNDLQQLYAGELVLPVITETLFAR